MHTKIRNRYGFALIDYTISFLVVMALMSVIFAVTIFMNVYIKALIMTRAYVVRPIIVYGGLPDTVIETIGFGSNGQGDNFMTKMAAHGFSVEDDDIIVQAKMHGESEWSYLFWHQPEQRDRIVQLRTPVRIIVTCKYNFWSANLNFTSMQLKLPIKIISEGRTEFFWAEGAGEVLQY